MQLLQNIICFRSHRKEKGWSESAGTEADSLIYKTSSLHIQEVVNIFLTGKKVIHRRSIDFSHCTHFLEV